MDGKPIILVEIPVLDWKRGLAPSRERAMNRARFFGEGTIDPLPRPERPALSAAAFVACPAALRPAANAGWVEDLYRLAFEQARAAVTPSWYERSRRVSLN